MKNKAFDISLQECLDMRCESNKIPQFGIRNSS